MSNERLIHDACFSINKELLHLIAHLIREEEHRDAFTEFYDVVRNGLLRYEVEQERLRQRLYGDRRN